MLILPQSNQKELTQSCCFFNKIHCADLHRMTFFRFQNVVAAAAGAAAAAGGCAFEKKKKEEEKEEKIKLTTQKGKYSTCTCRYIIDWHEKRDIQFKNTNRKHEKQINLPLIILPPFRTGVEVLRALLDCTAAAAAGSSCCVFALIMGLSKRDSDGNEEDDTLIELLDVAFLIGDWCDGTRAGLSVRDVELVSAIVQISSGFDLTITGLPVLSSGCFREVTRVTITLAPFFRSELDASRSSICGRYFWVISCAVGLGDSTHTWANARAQTKNKTSYLSLVFFCQHAHIKARSCSGMSYGSGGRSFRVRQLSMRAAKGEDTSAQGSWRVYISHILFRKTQAIICHIKRVYQCHPPPSPFLIASLQSKCTLNIHRGGKYVCTCVRTRH